MRCAPVVGMFEPNLECEKGHRFYASNSTHWITTKETQRFCIHEHCAGRLVRVRKIGAQWQYESPFIVNPPVAVEEQWAS